jgi:signal transduction histidine kinase
MTDRRITALLTPSLVAGALLGLLAFLFVRSEPLGVATDAHALSILRDMRYLDARLDAQALARANDLAQDRARPGARASSERAALFEPPLRQLANEAPHAALTGELPRLRAALADKEHAYGELEAAHQRSHLALADFERALPGKPAAAGGSAGQDDRSALLLGHLDDAFRSSDVRDFDQAAAGLALVAAALEPAGTRPAAREGAARSRAAADAFLAARTAETAAWRRYRFATAGDKITLAARTLSREIAGTLDDKERWRLYLYTYGAGLLLLLGYAGMRSALVHRSLVQERDRLQARLAERSDEAERLGARLESAETQFIEAQKMSTLGRMIAGVAHEIDGPLARTKGSLEEARRRLPDVREACERAERLVELLAAPVPDPAAIQAARAELARRLDELRDFRALDRLHAMAWDGAAGIDEALVLAAHLRSFSRADASRVTGFNVNDGVAATLLIARPLLRRVDVDKALGPVPSITCSPAQVGQVLLAMVTNALEAIDKPRGRLTIATRPAGPGSVAIDIADNGRGIAPEQLPRIFEPRRATRDSRPDGGLGLATARTIVQRHGGRIDVKSELQVGTTFTITLPVEPPEGFERQAANS